VRLKTVKEQKDEQNEKVAQLKEKLKKAIFNEEDSDLRKEVDALKQQNDDLLAGLGALLGEKTQNEAIVADLRQELNTRVQERNECYEEKEDLRSRFSGSIQKLCAQDKLLVGICEKKVEGLEEELTGLRGGAAVPEDDGEAPQPEQAMLAQLAIARELRAEIEELTAKLGTASTELQTKTLELSQEEAKVEACERTVTEKGEALGAQESRVSELEAELAFAQTASSDPDEATRLGLALSDANEALAGVRREVEAARREFEAADNKFNVADGKLTDATEEAAGLASQLESAFAQVSGLESDARTSQSTIASLTAAQGELLAQIQEKTAQITAFDKESVTLQGQLQECHANEGTIAEEIKTLREQLVSMGTDLATAATAQQECEAGKEDLLRQIAVMRAAVQPPPQPVVVPQPPLVVPQPRPQPTEADRMAAELAEYLATNAMSDNTIVKKSIKNITGKVEITTDSLTDDIQLLADAIDCKKIGNAGRRNVGLFIQTVHTRLLRGGKKGIAPGKYIFTIIKEEKTGEYTMSMTLNPPGGTPAGAQFPFKFDSAVSKENVSRFKKIGPLITDLIDGNKLTDEEKVFVKKFAKNIGTDGDNLTRYGMLAERGLLDADNEGYLGGLFHGLPEITGDDIEMILNLIFTMHSCNGGKAVVEEDTGELGNLFKRALETWMTDYVQVPDEEDDDPMRPFIEGVRQVVTTILTIDAKGKLTTDMEGSVNVEIEKIKTSFGRLDETSKAEAGLIFNRISAFLMTAAPKDGGTFITVNDVCKQFQTVRAFVVKHLDTTPAKDADMPDAGTNVQDLTYVPSDTMTAGAVGTTVSSLERMMGMLNAGK
jgi:predicted  nucleic acid-binding Zn-ribbon protein